MVLLSSPIVVSISLQFTCIDRRDYSKNRPQFWASRIIMRLV